MSRAVKLRGKFTGPGRAGVSRTVKLRGKLHRAGARVGACGCRAGVSRRQAKGELHNTAPQGRGARVSRRQAKGELQREGSRPCRSRQAIRANSSRALSSSGKKCTGRGARVGACGCCAGVSRRLQGPGRAGEAKGELHRAGARGVRVCRAVKLRGNSTGPGRAGVSRVVKLRGKSTGPGSRAGVSELSS